MRVLAIETATDQLGVAVVDENHVLASYTLLAERPHAVELPQALTKVLQAAGCTLKQLEGIVVDLGPGSFTGLRIGLAFVKALTFCTKTPLIGVASLDVLAAQVPFAPQRLCPILDAKRRQVYAALYEASHGAVQKQSDYLLVSVEDLVAMVKGPVIFLGDGVALYRQRLAKELGTHAHFAPPELWLPQPATLGRLGLARLQQGQQDNPKDLLPLYLYSMDCSIEAHLRVKTSASVRLTSSRDLATPASPS